jgi:NADH-quinone oxidoreductase subunit M
MGGLAARMPVWAAVFGFFVFASGGLPGLSGFVGEFLTLVGTFTLSPIAAAVAAFVMILAAGYLLYMYGRVVFGELSDFLVGLGSHLTDMTPTEILTLVPLGTLIVVFGLQPGLLLTLVQGTVRETLAAAGAGAPLAVDTNVVVIGVALVVLAVLVRIAFALRQNRSASPGPGPVVAEGGAAH